MQIIYKYFPIRFFYSILSLPFSYLLHLALCNAWFCEQLFLTKQMFFPKNVNEGTQLLLKVFAGRKPLPKNLYKNYTKCIQKLYKTLNLYIFCMQRLYKSKFCVTMTVKEMYIKFLHIYKKCTNCTKLIQSSD